MTVFTCSDEWEAMMTCIYRAWESGLGHRNIRLELESVLQQELFCNYVHIDGEPEKAAKVTASIRKKISWQAWQWVFYAAHSKDRKKLDSIYRFLIYGFHFGKRVTDMMTDPVVMSLFELSRKVGNEAHYFKEIARFTCHRNQVYVCHIEPENDILLMLEEQFTNRMPSEYWVIIDDGRKKALIHPKNENAYYTELSDGEWQLLRKTEKVRDLYTDLWKEFFTTVGIRERENPKCQRTMLPLRYRKHMTEFMTDS